MSKARQISEAIATEFVELPDSVKLDYLFEFSETLKALPAKYLEHPDLLEKVEECQSPVYLFVEVDKLRLVRVFMTAPPEAPTTRAFAAILQTILDGQPVDDVLAFDADYPSKIGLTSLVSPLRIRGMLGMLNRIKKQVQQKADKNG